VHRPSIFFAVLSLASLLAQASLAQVIHPTKATAPEKMMPSDKTVKMRECEKFAEQQKIKMEDRSRFVDQCVWAKQK
jgi:hypothetical protein